MRTATAATTPLRSAASPAATSPKTSNDNKITDKPGDTRRRIMDVAQAAVLEKGFSATSIEEIIAAVGITKSGFFYHFADKGELARAMLERYVERERVLFDELFRRADELSEDPLHSFLIALKLFAEMFEDLPATHPGCLTAAYCYQDRLFDKQVRDLNAASVLAWRSRFRERLERIAQKHPPSMPVDLSDVADMLSALADGGIILARVLSEPKALPRQILLYREFVRSLFAGAAAA
jgi:TetR/AcrR family transcriptional regulator, transcriptional repressor for nem operon